MSYSRIFSAAVALFLASAALFPAAAGTSDPNTSVGEWVDAKLAITFGNNLTECAVNGTFGIHKEVYSGAKCTAQQLRQIYAGANSQDRQAMVDALGRIIDEQADSLLDIFDGSKMTLASSAARCNISTLDGSISGGDEYSPPVVFYKDFSIEFKPAFFGMAKQVEMEAVRAFLNMGASASINGTKLEAHAGWNATYEFVLPHGLVFDGFSAHDSTGTSGASTWSRGASSASYSISNYKGTSKAAATLDMAIASQSAAVVSEEVRASVKIDAVKIPEMSLKATVNVSSIAVPAAARQRLPNAVKVDFMTADGIRMAYKYGWITKGDLDSAISSKIDQMESAVSGALGVNVTLLAEWSASSLESGYNTTTMGKAPPVQCFVNSSGPMRMNVGNASSRAIIGLLNAGAIIHQRMSIGDIGYGYDAELILPQSIVFNGSNPFAWTQDTPEVSGRIYSTVAPSPPYSSSRIDVTIDMKRISADVFKLIAGGREAEVDRDKH